MSFIRVSETFFSVQGEGITVGVPAVFIRLQGCNLDCGSQGALGYAILKRFGRKVRDIQYTIFVRSFSLYIKNH